MIKKECSKCKLNKHLIDFSPNEHMLLGLIKENFDTALNLAKYIQEDRGTI